jgi:branched-chain amino acid transport system ATP-binding protein
MGRWFALIGSLEPILEVRGVSKYFGSLKALDGVDLAIPRDKVTLLIGPNGSGKTTLINVITGVLRPDSGRIVFEGIDITDMGAHERFRLGIVRTFQIPRLFQNLSILENTVVGRHGNPGESLVRGLIKSLWYGFERRSHEDALDHLDRLNLRGQLGSIGDRRPRELSGGQMKLLEISRALMPYKPKLIIMDEPVAGVNPTLAHEILSFVKKVSVSEGVTFLIVEHRLDIAVEYADYAYAMHLGRVIAHGDPRSVLEDPRVIESYLGG